jgi:hypothetical protein
MIMEDGSPPQTTQLVWNVNAGAFGPARPGAEPATRYFIKGPIPLPWLQRAAAIPGEALHVALGLWFVRGLSCRATFQFKQRVTADLGVSRDATYDALTRMEEAGLIRVARHRGRSPLVTVLDVSS